MNDPLTFCSRLIFFTGIIFLISCKHKQANTLFSPLPATASGINFSNDIHDNDSSYSFINEFGYMVGRKKLVVLAILIMTG